MMTLWANVVIDSGFLLKVYAQCNKHLERGSTVPESNCVDVFSCTGH